MESIVADKSKTFALHIIRLYRKLIAEQKEYVLSKQLLRSGTSIGANARESVRAQSKPDFYSKLNIALKEADETLYWLELLYESGMLQSQEFQQYQTECNEIISILVAITKTQNKQRKTDLGGNRENNSELRTPNSEL